MDSAPKPFGATENETLLTRAQKESQIEELRERFGRAASVIVADYRGLSVQQVNELRGKLREADGEAEYRVAKNTLLRRAAAGSPIEPITSHLEGPTAIAMAFGEPVGLAKVLVEYAKDHEAFEIKGGVLDGKAVDREEIATLATLPSLLELRGRIVGLLQAPAQKILGVLQAPAGQLARVVEARRASLEESGGA